MIQTVIKRDGRIVGFNEEKIIAAIRKAMLHTEQGEDAQLIRQITDRIACTGKEQMSVEQIQDAVEMELMKSSRKEMAKNISLTATEKHSPKSQDARHVSGNHKHKIQRHYA